MRLTWYRQRSKNDDTDTDKWDLPEIDDGDDDDEDDDTDADWDKEDNLSNVVTVEPTVRVTYNHTTWSSQYKFPSYSAGH